MIEFIIIILIIKILRNIVVTTSAEAKEARDKLKKK